MMKKNREKLIKKNKRGERRIKEMKKRKRKKILKTEAD